MVEAWAAFGDSDGNGDEKGGGLWLLRWLKPGFRHCFVILADDRRWVAIDPTSRFTDVAAFDRADRPDLPDWLRAQGYTVVRAPLRRDRVAVAPIRPFTCVEAVKRILGLRAPFALTPWALCRHLQGIYSYD